jgi:hypothetical protein
VVETGRYIPVYGTYLIANLVLAHLAESHTPAFKSRMIFARKKVIAQPPGFDLDLSYFF